MEIGLRFLAFIIDVTVCFTLTPLLFTAVGKLGEFEGVLGLLMLPVVFAMFVVWPFLYFGVPTGLWGRTPGKWICRVKVLDDFGNPPGLWRGLGREALKLLAVACQIGAIFCVYQLLTHGITWYDQLCKTRVEFTPWVRLTATQKNFRKKYKPPRF